MVGDEGRDGKEDAEPVILTWVPRLAEVGVVGEESSEAVDERDTCWLWPIDVGELIVASSGSCFPASARCESLSGFNSRPRNILKETKRFGERRRV